MKSSKSTLMVYILLLLLYSGCAKNIKIVEAMIVDKDKSNLTLQLTTDINVRNFDDSNWAHMVYLDYNIYLEDEISDEIIFPYYAERCDQFIDESNQRMSYWYIKNKDTSREIPGDSYDLNKAGNYTISLKLRGGTMIGLTLDSNIYKVNYTNK